MTGAAVQTPRTLVERDEPPDVPAQSADPALIARMAMVAATSDRVRLLLLIVYAGLSFALNDPRGTLGTDTGGKLATLQMMERHGGLDPDIGYWADASRPGRDAPPSLLHVPHR